MVSRSPRSVRLHFAFKTKMKTHNQKTKMQKWRPGYNTSLPSTTHPTGSHTQLQIMQKMLFRNLTESSTSLSEPCHALGPLQPKPIQTTLPCRPQHPVAWSHYFPNVYKSRTNIQQILAEHLLNEDHNQSLPMDIASVELAAQRCQFLKIYLIWLVPYATLGSWGNLHRMRPLQRQPRPDAGASILRNL